MTELSYIRCSWRGKPLVYGESLLSTEGYTAVKYSTEVSNDRGDTWFVGWVEDCAFPDLFLIRAPNWESAYDEFCNLQAEIGHYLVTSPPDENGEWHGDDAPDSPYYTDSGYCVDSASFMLDEVALEFVASKEVVEAVESLGYSLKDVNSRGVIGQPGKFEGEPLWVLVAYDWYMNGDIGDAGDDNVSVWELSPYDDLRASLDLDDSVCAIVLHFSELGFVSGNTMDDHNDVHDLIWELNNPPEEEE